MQVRCLIIHCHMHLLHGTCVWTFLTSFDIVSRWAFARANIFWRLLFSKMKQQRRIQAGRRSLHIAYTEFQFDINFASVFTRNRRFCGYANFAKHVNINSYILCLHVPGCYVSLIKTLARFRLANDYRF